MSPSILVVDDDETIRETLVEFFSALELPARAVATASDGRRAIAEHSPDVALIDSGGRWASSSPIVASAPSVTVDFRSWRRGCWPPMQPSSL